MLKIKVNDREVRNYLARVEKRVTYGITDTITELSSVGYNMARSLAPKKTGALSNNITQRVYSRGNSVIGEIQSNPINGVPYNVYQEYGIGVAGASKLLHERAKGSPVNPRTDLTFNMGIKGFGAQPFMYPTFMYLQKVTKSKLSKMIKEEIA